MRDITRYFAVSTMGVVLGVSSVAAQAPRQHALLAFPADSQQERPHAVDHGDMYYTRLTIHRWGSYAMFPLFVTEYLLGDQLLEDENGSEGSKGAHTLVAGGIAVLFGVNTVTGLWNLWDARHDEGAARRYLHAGLMLAADAGFLLTAASAEDPDESGSGAEHHRNIALASMGVSAVGTVMMWLWK
jgi:hypothetical protein